MMPLDFLIGIMRGDEQAPRSHLDAAKAAAPYFPHATELSGPSGGPVSVQSTQKLDISDLSEEELDVLERALRQMSVSEDLFNETM
jgi:hypothetical protein